MAMKTLEDITDLNDIKNLVDRFYERVRTHETLGPIFSGTIKDQWPLHLDKMYRFWQTILLEEHTYFGSPFPPHARLPIEHAHFEEWMRLFTKTVDENFQGTRAEDAKLRAGRMAQMFELKLDYYRNKPGGLVV